MCKALRIRSSKSTAFHPQSDGQTERINQVLEAYLRNFINYDQNDWVELLPLAEFAYNNASVKSTKLSSFYANYGFHPNTNWSTHMDVKNPASSIYTHWLHAIHAFTQESLRQTHLTMSRYFDQTKLKGPQFKIGNKVMLGVRNIKTKRPMKKLAPKSYGPFEVTRVGTRTCTLDLKGRWSIHPTFHVSLLEPYQVSNRPDCHQALPVEDDIQGE